MRISDCSSDVCSSDLYTVEQGPRIAAKLAEFGRDRSAVEINAWPWVAVNDDEQAAIDDARPTVAGYAGIKEYEPFFAARGFLKEAKLCQQGDQSNSLAVMHHVPDEMVKARSEEHTSELQSLMRNSYAVF